MNLTICDRCKKSFKYPIWDILRGYAIRGYELDLCNDCIKDFKRFMKFKRS